MSPLATSGTSGEADLIDEDEADRMRDAEDGARYAREHKVRGMIEAALGVIGLAAEDISYEEQDERTACVELDDFEADLGAVAKLLNSGLAESYKISAGLNGGSLRIEFRVSPALDDAEFTPLPAAPSPRF